MQNILTRLLLCTLLTALLSACAKNPVTGNQDLVFMSEEQEIAIGRKNHAAIIKQFGRYDDEALQQYVQSVGNRVAQNSHRSNLIYRFTVLDSNQVNAFALPGGYIYITRGLMAYLNTEADLAAVLGHELGHVTARHGTRQHTASTITNILGAIISAKTGSRGASDLSNILGTALVRGYGRDHELEADKLGAEYLAKTGYNPDAMMRVIRVLKNQELYEKQLAKREQREPRTYHGVFSTHPDNDKRLKTVIAAANKFKKPGSTLNRENRQVFLARINNMVYGDSEKQGIRRGNRFFHNQLGFGLDFPKGWRIENQTSQIIAKSPTNSAMIVLKATDLNRRITPLQFMKTRMKLEPIKRAKAISPHGLQGHTAVSELGTPYGERNTRVGVVYHQNRAYVIYGVSRDTSFPLHHDRQFMHTINSFHALKPHEYKLAKPQRLIVTDVKKGMNISKYAADSNITNDPELQLRLLNDLYPDGEPKIGNKIKLVK